MSLKDAVSVRIVVDVHETKSGSAEMLAELGASVERASLPSGDYAVGRTPSLNGNASSIFTGLC